MLLLRELLALRGTAMAHGIHRIASCVGALLFSRASASFFTALFISLPAANLQPAQHAFLGGKAGVSNSLLTCLLSL